MAGHKDNFNLWFRKIIESLYDNGHAGFPILMLTLPLLERYLRSKSGVNEGNLSPAFYSELRNVFPVLKDEVAAKQFWQVYRNGILHQATLSQQDNKSIKMPDGWLSGDKKDVEIDSTGSFWVNPVEFAKRVLDVINRDFTTFEAIKSTSHPLATVQATSDGLYSTSGAGILIPPPYRGLP